MGSARNGISRRGVMAMLAAAAVLPHDARADGSVVRVGYIRSLIRRPVISLLDQPGPDAGLAGAKLAMDDNNTTGSTMGQSFDLVDVPVRKGANLPAALDQLAGSGRPAGDDRSGRRRRVAAGGSGAGAGNDAVQPGGAGRFVAAAGLPRAM